MRDLPSGTVTFLFTDIEGSTRLLHERGAEGYADALAEHRRVLREAFEAHGGKEVDTQGDAFFVAFPTAPDALAAAAAAQIGLALPVRMGVHTGTPLLAEEGYVGLDVNRAARIAAAGHGGQVLVSAATRALADGFELRELGEHRFKDLGSPEPVYQLGDGQFPPLKTISNTNLPRPASSFVGRDRELVEVLCRIENGARLVTLTGPGGSGKTRLALEAAALLVTEYNAGVFWIGLASLRDPALVTETISQMLGAKYGLTEHIGERELLLLLDNLEQVVDAAPELARVLQRCPNLTLLVTSRVLLRVQGEVEYPVPALAESEAVALFCERAQGEPSDDIRELCRRLDSLPLAVELAAARAKALSPAQILERLSESLDLLRGGRDADPRQQSLRATIEWSYDLLTVKEQRLFGRLSVFAGGCTLEAAEEVCAADLDTLQSLVEKSLVQRWGSGRFGMLETVREFALERLEATGERGELSRHHAEYLLALVERSAERHPADAFVVEAEHDNLRAALAWAAEVGDGELGLRLANTLWTIFWAWRGHYAEGLKWLKQGLAVGNAPTPLRLLALTWASNAAERLDDAKEARLLAAESVRLHREEGDGAGIAHATLIFGNALTVEGDFAGARSAYEEITTLLHEPRRDTLAAAIHNLALLDLDDGKYERARAQFEKAQALVGGDDDSTCALGLVALLQGRYDDARSLLTEALVASSTSGYTPCTIECLIGLAGLASATADPDRAARLLGTAERIFEEIPVRLSPTVLELRKQATDAVQLAEQAWTEGRAWSLEAAVEYAVRDIDSS